MRTLQVWIKCSSSTQRTNSCLPSCSLSRCFTSVADSTGSNPIQSSLGRKLFLSTSSSSFPMLSPTLPTSSLVIIISARQKNQYSFAGLMSLYCTSICYILANISTLILYIYMSLMFSRPLNGYWKEFLLSYRKQSLKQAI